jgi:ABC transport system ATP-binding/permease protein
LDWYNQSDVGVLQNTDATPGTQRMFKLVIQDDEGKTTVVPLIRDEITIGRKEGNTIRLTERNVSRRHARILRQNGEVQIEDLGSYNGIRVNNARIAERVSLRVSDQVQIGDYKLYLKAEGVEQVDDARTMPIERVDTARSDLGATDIIPAVAAAVAPPTQPMPIKTPSPGSLPPASQLIGNPNRTLVAVADTDPQGRPVASAAQVAAVLSSPVGYGKLVVLSSNFAGKEFELSRPQMIIGRTDENDIVVNHRSISRNHAKLVRETETGRYTISDLQSSNGVRVNGQDYGKVELRRGDVVDLGHVRLRFVEAGEDFVFSRDAVITDVPDSSSKKGMWIAAAAVVLLLIGGSVYFMMKKESGGGTKDGSNDIALADAGAQVAVVADAPAVEVTVDAQQASVAPDDKLVAQCYAEREAKRWSELIACAERLRPGNKEKGDELYKQGHAETKAEADLRTLNGQITEDNMKKARQAFDAISEDSVYKVEAKAAYEKAVTAIVEKHNTRFKGFVEAKDCASHGKLLKQLNGTLPTDILNQIKQGTCAANVAVIKDPKDTIPPKQECNYDELMDKGSDAHAGSDPIRAQQIFEQAYKCKPTIEAMRRIILLSCKNKNLARAQSLYNKADAGTKIWAVGPCKNYGMSLEAE